MYGNNSYGTTTLGSQVEFLTSINISNTMSGVEVLEDGQIQIRQATKIMEDGKKLSKTYHRWVLSPGQDLTGQEAKVKTVAESVWTKEAIAAFKAKQAK